MDLWHQVLSQLSSQNSRRAYRSVFSDFHGRELSRDGVVSYLEEYRAAGASASTLNLKLAALVALARGSNLTGQELTAIEKIPRAAARGCRQGNWLSLEQAQTLIAVPGDGLAAIRDRALLAVLLGSAVRRAELASLSFDHLRMIDGRWCLVDILGKGNRLRTVPLPAFSESPLVRWLDAAQIKAGPVWRRCYGNAVKEEGIGPDHIHTLVEKAGQRLGIRLAPHDLRRTFAQLSRRGAAPIEQIQETLGHSDVRTTQRYLGGRIALARGEAACDAIGL